jgi:hypothetical protein
MKLFLMTAITLFCAAGFSEGKVDLSKYQTIDMKQMVNPTASSGSSSSGIKFSANMTCKTEDGRELKQTDPEYQSCLVKAQSKANRPNSY